MQEKILSFDIEIADVFDVPEGGSIDQFAPFSISVAATVVHGEGGTLWYTKQPDRTPAATMGQEDARAMLEYLRAMQAEGFKVCAWNGLSFDLRWIGWAARDMALAREVALQSYDPMFQFFMLKGFPVALAKVAEAMGVKQTKLMDGADAPREWQAGNYERVMAYVMGDCQITNEVVLRIMQARRVDWRTQRGRLGSVIMPGLRTVESVLGDPEPDQSWMDTPIPREKFCGWLNDVEA